MNKFKKLLYIYCFFVSINLVSSFSKESNFKDSREFPSEDSDWFVTAVSLELFPQDDDLVQESNNSQPDASSDEPNILDD